ncbi:MAG: flagellar FlbD family protein [Frankiaceae bacterium]
MISLTRRNGAEMYLNADLVATVEPAAAGNADAGCSVITLVDGQRLVVREAVDEVVRRITRYRAALLTLTEEMSSQAPAAAAAGATPRQRDPVEPDSRSRRAQFVLREQGRD